MNSLDVASDQPIQTFIPCNGRAILDLSTREEMDWQDYIFTGHHHQPLKVVRWESEGVLVEGVIEGGKAPSSLLPRSEGEKLSIQRRVFDYIASVEALDRRVVEVQIPERFNYFIEKAGLNFKFVKDTEACCLILDQEECWWGPLTLDPYEEQRVWPFPGIVGSREEPMLSFEPRTNRRDSRVTVRRGPFEMDLAWSDAIQLGMAVRALDGDFEAAVQQQFPHGFRLGHGPVRAS